MRLSPVVVVEAEWVGLATVTSSSSARGGTSISLRIWIRAIVLVQIRLHLVQIESDLIADAIRPRGHEVVEGCVVGLDDFVHGLEKRLTLCLQLLVHVADDFMAQQLIDGAAIGAELLHDLASSAVAVPRAMGMNWQCQDGGSDTNCELLARFLAHAMDSRS